MSEQLRRCHEEQAENQLKFNAAAFAYNKNKNILVAPNTITFDNSLGVEELFMVIFKIKV